MNIQLFLFNILLIMISLSLLLLNGIYQIINLAFSKFGDK